MFWLGSLEKLVAHPCCSSSEREILGFCITWFPRFDQNSYSPNICPHEMILIYERHAFLTGALITNIQSLFCFTSGNSRSAWCSEQLVVLVRACPITVWPTGVVKLQKTAWHCLNFPRTQMSSGSGRSRYSGPDPGGPPHRTPTCAVTTLVRSTLRVSWSPQRPWSWGRGLFPPCSSVPTVPRAVEQAANAACPPPSTKTSQLKAVDWAAVWVLSGLMLQRLLWVCFCSLLCVFSWQQEHNETKWMSEKKNPSSLPAEDERSGRNKH